MQDDNSTQNTVANPAESDTSTKTTTATDNTGADSDDWFDSSLLEDEGGQDTTNPEEDPEKDGDDSQEDTNADAEDTSKNEDPNEDAKERNRTYAEARLAQKQQAEQNNQQFIDTLQHGLRERVQELQPDEEKYEQLAEEEGEQFAEMQRRQDAIELREKQREIEHQVQQIEYQRNFIGMDISKAESSIPMFNPSSEEYNQDLHETALEDWAAGNLETFVDQDGNTQILGMKEGAMSPSEFLAKRAGTYKKAMQGSRIKAQAAAQKNLHQGEQGTSQKTNITAADDEDAFVNNFFN